MENKISTGSEVSLVEIILSVFIFAVAGAIMLNCFASARYTQIRAYDKTVADMKVQTEAEYIRATKSPEELDTMLADRFGSFVPANGGSVYLTYFDKDWQSCSESEGLYMLTLTILDDEAKIGTMKDVQISVDRTRAYPFAKDKSSNIFEIQTKKYYSGELES